MQFEEVLCAERIGEKHRHNSQRKIPQDERVYQNSVIPHLYEAQQVSGDTLPIIRSLKLHWQPLVFHTWKVVGRVVVGRCQVHCA